MPVTGLALEAVDGDEVGGGAWGRHVAGTVSQCMSREGHPLLGMVSRSASAHHRTLVGKRWWESQAAWLVRVLSITVK